MSFSNTRLWRTPHHFWWIPTPPAQVLLPTHFRRAAKVRRSRWLLLACNITAEAPASARCVNDEWHSWCKVHPPECRRNSAVAVR